MISQDVVQQLIPVPTKSISLNASQRGLIISQQVPPGLDTFITDFGNSIDVQANANFVTFRVYANGSLIPGFDNLTSQVASANAPRHYRPAIKIGDISLIEVYGEVAAGAAGATVLSAQITLASLTKGRTPDV